LRESAAIRADHPANQELFHRLCSAGFDDDTGACGLDQFNAQFTVMAEVLSGIPSGVGSLFLSGVDSIRLEGQSRAAASFMDPGNPNQGSQLTALVHKPMEGSTGSVTRSLPLSALEPPRRLRPFLSGPLRRGR
jgi:hypothetical protein